VGGLAVEEPMSVVSAATFSVKLRGKRFASEANIQAGLSHSVDDVAGDCLGILSALMAVVLIGF